MRICGPTLSLVAIISSVFICCIGITLKIFLPDLIQNTIAKNLVISNNSANYESWKQPPIATYIRYYVFNYTNTKEFYTTWMNGTKPRVEELGPYTYRQKRCKDEVIFHSEDEVEYITRKELEFVPEMSNGLETDLVYFPHIVLRTVALNGPRDDPVTTTMLLQMADTARNPFVKHTVGEFLFDGYVEELFTIIRTATRRVLGEDDKFSLMKRNSTGGPIRVKTGNSDISELGKIVSFNGSSTLNFWPEDKADSACNMINGTDGSMFPPKIATNKRLYIFLGESCRSIYLRFAKEVDHHGIKANRFQIDMESLSNTDPDFECFCKSENNKCWGSGVFNMAACKSDSQILLSLPHLMYADYHIQNAIDGLSPNPEKHMFFWDIEPNTGIMVNISGKMQLNLGVVRTPWLPVADNLPEIILPILWIHDGVDLNETVADLIKSKIYTPLMLSSLIPMIVLGLGGLIGILGILCSMYFMFKVNKTAVIHPQPPPTKEKVLMQAFAY